MGPPNDLPPSYGSSLAPPPQPTTAEPPTYTTATNTPQTRNTPSISNLTLILRGPQIAPSHDLSKPLYVLNRPPQTGLRDVYELSKLTYRLTETTGEGRVRQKEKRIYDFWSNYKTGVDVAGKTGNKSVCVTTYSPLWSSCTVKGHFSCGRSMKARFKKDTSLEWKDEKGEVVAVEVRGDEVSPPRLEVRREVRERDLDLLVACWCARVFRQSVGSQKPQAGFSLERCEYKHP